VAHPIRGTFFYDAVEEYLGQEGEDWKETSENRLLHPAEFSGRFYKRMVSYLTTLVYLRQRPLLSRRNLYDLPKLAALKALLWWYGWRSEGKDPRLARLLTVATQAGATPVVMDIDAFALQNAYELNYQPEPNHTAALLNIGASMMNINIVRGGVPLFTRDVTVGGNHYTHTLQKELDLSFEEAEKLKLGKGGSPEQAQALAQHLRTVSEILLLEIQKTFDFFHQTAPAETIQAIYIGGGTARTEGLKELLAAEFNVPVEILDPFRQVALNPEKLDSAFIAEVAPRMSVAVGLALRSFDAV
jgi:cell division ATPase FtsA